MQRGTPLTMWSWHSPPMTYSYPLTQNGSLKDYHATLNASFDTFRGAIIAYAVTNRSGSAGTYQYPLPPNVASISVPASMANDPRGTAISYARVTTPISSTPSLLVGYTLTAYGPDGTAGTADDIALSVSVAELQYAFSKVGF